MTSRVRQTPIDRVIAHLSAAEVQLIPSDDAIIAEHIRAALRAAREAKEEEGRS